MSGKDGSARAILVITITILIQILASVHGWTCPPPGAEEMNVIVLKKYSSYYGTVYRFEETLDDSDLTDGWDLVTGSDNDEVSYFKAYRNPVGPQYEGSGLVGVTKFLKCGGFEQHVRVCRTAFSAQGERIIWDYLSTDWCGGRGASEQFSFYVSDSARVYEGTAQYMSALCRNWNPERETWAGRIRYGTFSCYPGADEITFHAVRGHQMCDRIESAPQFASVSGGSTADGIWLESLSFTCHAGYQTSSGETEQNIRCQEGEWNSQPEPCQSIN